MSTVPPVPENDELEAAALVESAGRVSERESGVAFRNASREARWVLGAWAVAAAWVVGYSSLYGYEKPTGEIEMVFGIPAWVFWGVAVPWLAMTGFITWFGLHFIADDPMGPEDGPGTDMKAKEDGEKGSQKP